VLPLKLDRLLAITMLLLSRKRVSAKELSDRFEVSLRTVYRDVETINQSGIPIVSYPGASGGYEIMDQYRLDRQLLSLEELHSIIIGLKGIRSTMDDQDIGGLLDKVGALVAKSEQGAVSKLSDQLIIDINPWHDSTADKEKLSSLRTAIRLNRLTHFHYTNAKGEDEHRVCEPMSVVLKGYVWYLYGFCRLREDLRVFRLSRMRDLELLQETFVRRSDSLGQLDYHRISHDAPSLIRLMLQFHPRVKARVQDYFQHGDISYMPDGSLLVTATQPEDPWLYSALLGYGADLRILEPAHVAHIVKNKAQEIVNMYKTLT
jgi:predicted DNA-binding transcriptional regulator YafY